MNEKIFELRLVTDAEEINSLLKTKSSTIYCLEREEEIPTAKMFRCK